MNKENYERIKELTKLNYGVMRSLEGFLCEVRENEDFTYNKEFLAETEDNFEIMFKLLSLVEEFLDLGKIGEETINKRFGFDTFDDKLIEFDDMAYRHRKYCHVYLEDFIYVGCAAIFVLVDDDESEEDKLDAIELFLTYDGEPQSYINTCHALGAVVFGE